MQEECLNAFIFHFVLDWTYFRCGWHKSDPIILRTLNNCKYEFPPGRRAYRTVGISMSYYRQVLGQFRSRVASLVQYGSELPVIQL